MEQIVVTYEIDGGYECNSYTEVSCFLYESSESWLVEFERKLKEHHQKLEKYHKM